MTRNNCSDIYIKMQEEIDTMVNLAWGFAGILKTGCVGLWQGERSVRKIACMSENKFLFGVE